MPTSCSRAAAATTTSASFVVKPCEHTTGSTPRRLRSRSRRREMFMTFCTWIQEWSDICSLSALTCCANHQALSCLSALTCSRSAASRGLRSAGALICISAIVSSYMARNCPRLTGATLLACAVLAASCGGGGDESVSVDDYANDLCTALKEWSEELRGRQTELQEGAAPRASPEDARAARQQFVDGAAAAPDDLAQAVEDR